MGLVGVPTMSPLSLSFYKSFKLPNSNATSAILIKTKRSNESSVTNWVTLVKRYNKVMDVPFWKHNWMMDIAATWIKHIYIQLYIHMTIKDTQARNLRHTDLTKYIVKTYK